MVGIVGRDMFQSSNLVKDPQLEQIITSLPSNIFNIVTICSQIEVPSLKYGM
jgi:hypothetical protein